MSVCYSGIGARLTPGIILNFWDDNPLSCLRRWGCWLGALNLTLRSGAAGGADHAFESGCNIALGKKEIYLPWKCFNSSDSDLYYIPPEAYEVAGDVYGATWKFQKGATRKFMARNMMQVMGLGLDEPSKFVLCWTPDGCTNKEQRTQETGGTGQAIAYADEMGIPVFNFKNEFGEDEFVEFLFNHLEEYGINEHA